MGLGGGGLSDLNSYHFHLIILMYGTGRDLLMLNLPLNKGIHNETWAFKCQRLDGPGDLSQRPDINCGSPGMAFKTKKEKSIFLE